MFQSVGQQADVRLTERALFIINAASQFRWDQELPSFSIAIFRDKELYEEILRLAKTRTIHQLKISPKLIAQTSQIKDCQMVYANQSDGIDAFSVFKTINGAQVLFIGENYQFNECHLNLLRLNDELMYEMCSDKLQANGFKVAQQLSTQSVQTSEKWYRLYTQSQKNLASEQQLSQDLKSLISQKEQLIKSLSAQIAGLELEIKGLNTEILQDRKEIQELAQKREGLSTQIDEKSKRIYELEEMTSQALTKLTQQLKELDTLELQIIAQKTELDGLMERSNSQMEQIDTQKNTIKDKNSQLAKSRLIIGLFFLIIGLIAFLAFLLYRSNRLKKRNNDLLLAKNKQIEERRAEMEQFAYIASHDLLSPVNTIIGFSSLLGDTQTSPLDEFQALYLEHIVSSSHRMKQLIKDLLEFSLIGQEGKEEVFRLSDLLKEIQADLHAQITASKADIQLHISNDPVVFARKTEIRSLLQNLITNAIKFQKPGTQPLITLRINQSTDQGLLKTAFELEDNGIGIEPHNRESVFKVFKRLHSEEEYSGTGIGLANCKRIIQRYNGDITIEDGLQGGSKFVFSIFHQADAIQ